MKTRITSHARGVTIGDNGPTVLIGERINPSGKSQLTEALRSRNLEAVRREALDQVQAGADILDINVSISGEDEERLLPLIVQVVSETVDVPLCLDSPNPIALEAALRIYRGKPLVNSVTGEERSMSRVLPLVKEFGAAVVGLTIDDQGIPRDWERRLAIARKIVERAEAAGISREDVIIDCVTSAIGANEQSGTITLEAIRRIKTELEVNVVLGASNISFGLPDRAFINAAFVSAAIGAGVNSLIVDVAPIYQVVLAADLVLGRDTHAKRYIAAYRQRRMQQGSFI